MKIDGQCFCGAIRYEAEVDPEQVYVCHCADCQAISGGTYRWAVPVPEADFKLLAGETKYYEKTADSGRKNHQHFCPTCASPIFSRSLGTGSASVNLRLGTARQRDRLPPRVEVWCGSKQPWAVIQSETRAYEEED